MSGIPFPTLLSFYPYPQSLCRRCTLTSLTKFSGIDRFPFTQPAQLAVLGGCEIKVLAAEPCSKKREQGRGGWYFWRLRRQISLDYITTAPPPNLTRLLHNTASYADYHLLYLWGSAAISTILLVSVTILIRIKAGA